MEQLYESSSEDAPQLSTYVFGNVLSLAHEMHLMTDESEGNISVNAGEDQLLVSPNQVDESLLTERDAITVEVDAMNRRVTYFGNRKPSTYTGLSSLLYREFPELEAIMNFHVGWGKIEAKTEFAYHCSAQEQADEMISSIRRADSEDIAVELAYQRFIIGLKSGDQNRLRREWLATRLAFTEHLIDVGRSDIDENLLRPIFDGTSVAGVIYDKPSGAAVFFPANTRGSGLGRQVVSQLIERQYKVQTIDDCHVRDFYKKFGFSEVYDAKSESYIMTPPARQLQRQFEL